MMGKSRKDILCTVVTDEQSNLGIWEGNEGRAQITGV